MCAQGWAARTGAATRRVRPRTVRLRRAVPTVSFPPSASPSSPPTSSGCSLSLQRPDTEKEFLTPSPPARVSRRPHLAGWRGGGGRAGTSGGKLTHDWNPRKEETWRVGGIRRPALRARRP